MLTYFKQFRNRALPCSPLLPKHIMLRSDPPILDTHLPLNFLTKFLKLKTTPYTSLASSSRFTNLLSDSILVLVSCDVVEWWLIRCDMVGGGDVEEMLSSIMLALPDPELVTVVEVDLRFRCQSI